MHEPAGHRPAASGAGGEQPPDRHAGDDQLLADAEVRQQQHGDRVALGGDPGGGADAALEVEARHARCRPRPRPRPAASPPPREASAAACAARTSSAVTCIRRQSLRKESSHSPTTGITTSSATSGCALELDLAGGVVHPPELHRRGQVDRRLRRSPLGGGEEAGALAGAVEHGAAGRHRPVVGVLGEQQRDAGARDAASGRRAGSSRWTVACPRPTPGDVEHRVGRSGRQGADPDPQVARARHALILPEASGGRVGCWRRARSRWSGHPRHDGTPRARGLGRRADARHRGPRPGRRDPRRRWPAHPLPRGDAARRRAARARSTTGELLAFLEGAAGAWAAGPYAELVGQDRVVPYFFPTAGAARRHGARRRATALHAQTGQFCYDTMTLVGPGTWEAARAAVDVRPDGGRPGRRRRAGGVRAVPAAGSPRDAGRVRRLVLPQQRRGGRRGAARRRARAGRGGRRRRPPRQRHPGDLLGAARRALRVAARRPGRRAGSRTSSATPPRPGSRPGPARPATSRCPRAPATRPGSRPSPTSPAGWRPRGAPRWSSRSASTPPPTTRRARCR